MAARSGKRTRVTETIEDPPEEQRDPIIPGDVEGLMAELGDTEGVVIGLWRVDPIEGERMLTKMPASEWKLEDIMREYGGGKFKVRLQSNTPDQKNRRNWVRAHTFVIEGPPRIRTQLPGGGSELGNGSAAPGTALVSAPGGMPSWLSQLLMATAPVLATTLIAKLTEKPTTDPIMLELIRALGSVPKGEGLTAMDVHKLLAETRREEREHAKEIAEIRSGATTEPGDGGLAGVLRETIPPMLEMFREGMRRQDAPVPAARQTTVATVTPVATAAAVTSGGVPAWVARVRPFVPAMVRWADGGKTPELKAANTIDDLSDVHKEELAESCEAETFVDEALVWFPECASTPARKEWFTRFFAAIQDAMAPVESGEDVTEGGEDGAATEGPGGTEGTETTEGGRG